MIHRVDDENVALTVFVPPFFFFSFNLSPQKKKHSSNKSFLTNLKKETVETVRTSCSRCCFFRLSKHHSFLFVHLG